MSNIANSSASFSAAVNGSQTNIAFSAQATMVGGNAALLTGTATTTPTAISLGAAATIGKLLVKALVGSGSQRIILSLDNPATKIVSDFPEGEGVLLYRVGWEASGPTQHTVYVSCNTGTLQFQYALSEQ